MVRNKIINLSLKEKKELLKRYRREFKKIGIKSSFGKKEEKQSSKIVSKDLKLKG